MEEIRKNKQVKLVVFLLFFLLLLGISIYYFREDYQNIQTTQEHVQNDIITFSEDSGIYHHTLHLKLHQDLSFSTNSKIYYTLDGNDPTNQSELYKDEIVLEATKQTKVIPLKAVIEQNGEYSSIIEKSYILDENDEAYALPIVSVSINENDLHNRETGIFYDSRVDDGYRNVYKNGDEWIRPSHVTIFDENGNILVNQNTGMSVSGGTSVESDIKSFNLKADLIYDEDHEKLHITWFEDEDGMSDASFVYDYNSIKLRSGSQDKDYGNIRSSLVSRLAEESGFTGCSKSKRCIVYLNGELYGIFDIQQKNTMSNIKKLYGLEGNHIVAIHKGTEEQVLSAAGIRDLFLKDLNDPKNQEAIEKVVDMDQMLFYYAINILNDNKDWPANNYGMWKYNGEYDINNPYSDGRYRFVMFDTDLTFYTKDMHKFIEFNQDEDIFSQLMSKYAVFHKENRAYKSIFHNLMLSKKYSHQFVTIVCDLLNTSYQKENILSIVDEEYEKVRQPMIDSGIYHYKHADECIEQLKDAIEVRENSLRQYFTYYFGLLKTYELSIHNDEGVTTSWNMMNIYGNEDYTGQYYYNIDLTLSADAYPGYQFNYWIVNGKKYFSRQLQITNDMIINGKITIETSTTKLNGELLLISEFSAKGDNDWYKITNVGNQSAKLKNYYLSDTIHKLNYYQLPDLTLQPNESIIINGKKNNFAQGNYISTISLNSNETLYLSNEEEIIDSLAVPNMSQYETYGRYLNSNHYKYFLNDMHQRRNSTY